MASILIVTGKYTATNSSAFSEKPKTFCCSLIANLESIFYFEDFLKNEHHSLGISETIDSKRRVYLNA